MWFFFCFFFFQAEDGIRDADVTGVQTCALPIWPRRADPGLHWRRCDGTVLLRLLRRVSVLRQPADDRRDRVRHRAGPAAERARLVAVPVAARRRPAGTGMRDRRRRHAGPAAVQPVLPAAACTVHFGLVAVLCLSGRQLLDRRAPAPTGAAAATAGAAASATGATAATAGAAAALGRGPGLPASFVRASSPAGSRACRSCRYRVGGAGRISAATWEEN